MPNHRFPFWRAFLFCSSRAILDNQDLRSDTPFYQLWFNDFWGTKLTLGGSHKSFRPLCVATFRLNFLLHGLSPAGYHALNVILHILNTAVFMEVIRKISGNSLLATLAGLSFAVHPIHTEAVAGIVGRADLGACLFFLLSLLFYMHYCQRRDQVVILGRRSSDGNHQMNFQLDLKQPLCMPVKGQEQFPSKGPIQMHFLIATCACSTISCLFKGECFVSFLAQMGLIKNEFCRHLKWLRK